VSKKIVTATLSLALGLLPASCILAADADATVHADAKAVHKDRHQMHRDHTAGEAGAVKKDDADAAQVHKEVHKAAKAAPKKKLRWSNDRRHMKHDPAAQASDTKEATDAEQGGEGGEQAAGDEQKSGN
jgi:hypothetical protein